MPESIPFTQVKTERHETSIMLLRHLNEKPTAVEGLAMGGKNVSKEDRVVFAQTALGDFERRWKVEGKRL